jgi:phage tail sheath protein FI
MSEKKFNFVSPGIFLEEIDNSQLPNVGPEIGPVIIGRTERGPAMRPVMVKSFSEYVELFGNPVPGGRGGDVFRDGNYSSPMYGGYAAQAWLRNNTPATIVRLLGNHHPNRDTPTTPSPANAGWDMGNVGGAGTGANADKGGAYGLFLMATSSTGEQKLNLGAVFYSDDASGAIVLSGTMEQAPQHTNLAGDAVSHTTTASQCIPIAVSTANRGAEFTAQIGSQDAVRDNTAERFVFNFDENSDNYIRKVFNTNPTLTNSGITIASEQKTYFLGETFERSLMAEETYGQSGSPRTGLSGLNDVTHGVFVGLTNQGSSGEEYADRQREASKARTGWFISQDMGDPANFKPANQQQLFKLVAHEEGEWLQKNVKISIEAIKPSTNKLSDFGTFTVVLRKIDDLDKAPKVIERFTSCDLNPNSANYVARKIGDKYIEWDESERRYRHFGNYTNMSKYVYVQMNDTVHAGGVEDRLLPFGFFGPPKLKDAGTEIAVAATSVDALECDDINPGGAAENVNISFTIPTAAGGAGTITWVYVSHTSTDGDDVDAPGTIGVGIQALADSAAATAAIIDAINGDTNVNVTAATSGNGATGGVPGVTAAEGTTDTRITLTMTTTGNAGNITGTTPLASTRPLIVAVADNFSGGKTGLTVDTDLADGHFIDPTKNQIEPRTAALKIAHTDAILTTPGLNGSFLFPKIPLKLHGTQGNLPKPSMQYWGVDLAKSGSTKLDRSLLETLRPISTLGPDVSDSPTELEYMYVFSLDNLCESGSIGASYTSGSRATHLVDDSKPWVRGSATSMSGSSALLTGSGLGYNRFTTVFHGGSDGFDVTEKDPFRNTFITANGSDTNNYAFYSIKRAIDSVRDAEVAEMNLAVMPGITQPALTEHLISICEDRGDALAIIDLEKDYVPPHDGEEAGLTESARKPDVILAVNKLKARQINSSYGCAYFPWVQIRDTISNALLYVPSSVVALGTMGSSEARRELWFAPAGFTRGGLSTGAAGVPVTGVKLQLSSDDRDKLYAANINPIATFPAEGIVIFGQKTLQVTASALDRINVRRLLIFIKKQVSRIAATTLFEQNVSATWNGFKGQVETFLSNVKGGLGLTDFKVVLDETTTTPELIDRNIMYAKVFLKPAQAIEFIALDFIITDSGASFDD